MKIDDLIKAAKSEPIEEANSTLSDIEKFAIAINLKPGRYSVYSKILYDCYVRWSLRPASNRKFVLQFNAVFRPITSRKRNYYRLNKSEWDIWRRSVELSKKYEEK